jgi:hypothetical protein
MLESQQIEELICMVSAMPREVLIERFLTFRGAFPIDFTNEFLNHEPLDRLQHIFVALCLQNRHMPAELVADAA